MLNRKTKLKSIYVFMVMILLMGLFQPGLALASTSAIVDEDNSEEIIIEDEEEVKIEVESVEAEVTTETDDSVEEVEEPLQTEDSTEEVEKSAEPEETADTNDDAEEMEEPSKTEESTEEVELSAKPEETTEAEVTEETEELMQILNDDSDVDISDIVIDAYLDGNVVSNENNMTNLVLNVTDAVRILHTNVFDEDGDLVGFLWDESVRGADLTQGVNTINFSTNYCPSFAS